MIKSYKHPDSDVIIHKVGSSETLISNEPEWYVQDGDGSEWGKTCSESEARILAYWAMRVEITLLQNKIDSLTEWAEQIKEHGFQEVDM